MNSWLNPTLTFPLENEQATQTLAHLIARFAVVGDLIRLEGDLGAGKTTFAQAFLRALGHTGDVPSPTYTLVQTYETTRLPIAHIDCYRLKSPDELTELELEPYRHHGLILAEWPDKGGDFLRANQPDQLNYHMGEMNNCGVLTLHLAPGLTPNARIATLTCSRSWRRRIGFWPRINPTFAATASTPLARASTEAGRQAFLHAHNIHPTSITSVGSDWSFRTYWRLTFDNGTTRILMDAPPPLEGTKEFANVSRYYRAMGLHAPEVFAMDETHGYMLLEDLGNTSLASTLSPTNPQTAWYKAALGVLHTASQAIPAEARRYTATDWWLEASRFTDWYMPLATGTATPPATRAHFQHLWMELWPFMQTLPQGFIMFDFHAANLLLLGDEPSPHNLGLIDIQDARVAPVVQDMAILLRDDRRGRDEALEAELLAYAAQQFNISPEILRTGFDIASLHHCCRVLGGASRLLLRDGRTRMATAIARRWDIAEQSAAEPKLQAILAFMRPYKQAGIAAAEEKAKAA